ncbi:flagellar biosynthetic protein FliO [Pseudodesulfovibrio sp.]|uniref:flagellar biosynthetic protein FliO n=1 Tax=unclassified Pseudodesulfovibrio TaxID=2661612 RepID=UPI003AFFD92F
MVSPAAANATAAATQLPHVDTWSTVLTTAGYLCLLLGVIFLAYWLLRRLGLPGATGSGGSGGPRLINRLVLGQRQSVVVVRYRERDYLLGVTEQHITPLAEEDMEELPETEPGKSASFATLLKRSMGK